MKGIKANETMANECYELELQKQKVNEVKLRERRERRKQREKENVNNNNEKQYLPAKDPGVCSSALLLKGTLVAA